MTQLQMQIRLVLMVVLMGVLAACGGSGGGDAQNTPAETVDTAAQAVERYLTAKANSDEATLRPLLCSAMEADLPREAASFSSVTGVRIEGMTCSSKGSDSAADETIVQCEGKIIANYGAEDNEFPLTSYRAVREDGEWKWCGESGS